MKRQIHKELFKVLKVQNIDNVKNYIHFISSFEGIATFETSLKNHFTLEYDYHETDVYIIYDKRLIELLDRAKVKYNTFISDVKGNSWYGKKCIEIPFLLID